jgi:uncharacterized protein
VTDPMTPAQRAVAEQVVAEEVGKRTTLVISLCGAHAYGFASVDSDLDLKGVWAAPCRRLLGLGGEPGAVDRQEWIDDVEVDFTVNELIQAVRGVLKGNGNRSGRSPAKLDGVSGGRRARPKAARSQHDRAHHGSVPTPRRAAARRAARAHP